MDKSMNSAAKGTGIRSIQDNGPAHGKGHPGFGNGAVIRNPAIEINDEIIAVDKMADGDMTARRSKQ